MHGVPGVCVIARQERRRKQDNATTQHLLMGVQHVQERIEEQSSVTTSENKNNLKQFKSC